MVKEYLHKEQGKEIFSQLERPNMNDDKKGEAFEAKGVTRRRFLLNATVGTAAGFAGAVPFAVAQSDKEANWDREADIIVVGSGAASSVAAISAAHAGSSVIIVEKAAFYGGTTARSAGGFWIPNHRIMRERGEEDPREDALRYMARSAYPNLYRPGEPHLGLPEMEYNLLATYYDNAAKAVEFLESLGTLKYKDFLHAYDYIDSASENKVPRDRCLFPLRPDGGFGLGNELVRQLKSWIDANKIPILLKHRVQKAVRNEQGRVIGIEAATPNGGKLRLRAHKAVFFGTGGFTHNAELVRRFQPAPISGGGAMPACEGDFVAIAESVGAKLGNMGSAWRAQVVLEQALEFPSVSNSVYQPPGDSMIMVNKYGKRVVGEKRNYNERTRAHNIWDANKSEYLNQYLFMVYDRRCAELFAGNFPLPPPGSTAPYVISGLTLEDLAKAIQERLDKFAPKIGAVRLENDFTKTLAKTISAFNRYAKAGVDEEFQRGKGPYDADWHKAFFSVPRTGTAWKTGQTPSVVMHPFQPKGPYYAVIVAGGTLDTNGGPMINQNAQVIGSDNQPIPGLYGAGNCIASPSGHSYFGSGTTIGLAITFGYLAGTHAARAST